MSIESKLAELLRELASVERGIGIGPAHAGQAADNLVREIRKVAAELGSAGIRLLSAETVLAALSGPRMVELFSVPRGPEAIAVEQPVSAPEPEPEAIARRRTDNGR